MAKKYYQSLKLRGDYDYEITSEREPGERIRTFGVVCVDRSVFKKSNLEKELLKVAKAREKYERERLQTKKSGV